MHPYRSVSITIIRAQEERRSSTERNKIKKYIHINSTKLPLINRKYQYSHTRKLPLIQYPKERNKNDITCNTK